MGRRKRRNRERVEQVGDLPCVDSRLRDRHDGLLCLGFALKRLEDLHQGVLSVVVRRTRAKAIWE